MNHRTSTKAEERVFEVIKDSDERKGVLTNGVYICPALKCDSQEVYSYLEPRLDMAEIQVARNVIRVGENTEHLNTARSKFMGEVESRGNKKHASLLADSLSLLLKGALRHITRKVII